MTSTDNTTPASTAAQLRLLSKDEAADILGISPRTLDRLLGAKPSRGPARTTVGSRVMISTESLDRYIRAAT